MAKRTDSHSSDTALLCLSLSRVIICSIVSFAKCPIGRSVILFCHLGLKYQAGPVALFADLLQGSFGAFQTLAFGAAIAAFFPKIVFNFREGGRALAT